MIKRFIEYDILTNHYQCSAKRSIKASKGFISNVMFKRFVEYGIRNVDIFLVVLLSLCVGEGGFCVFTMKAGC